MNQKGRATTNIRDHERYLKNFNSLTQKIFGFDFENWYASGYWTDKYCPHVFIDGEKIISNVSVNTMEFQIDGKIKKFIQLGTVMTDIPWKKQGLNRLLMEEILAEWKDKTDGIYLFANNSALDYYPKFGFESVKEYQYSKPIESILCDDKKIANCERKNTEMTSILFSMELESNRKRLVEAIDNSYANSVVSMVNNPELVMFYTTSFMKECIFYIIENDTFVIAETEEDNLIIHDIFSPGKVDIDEVILAIYASISSDKRDAQISNVVLGFTPKEKKGFKKEILSHGDNTLFIMGDKLKELIEQEIMFPTMSHA